MARIAGVNIPTNKVVQIGLMYIYGIGEKFSSQICNALNIPNSMRINELSDDQILKILERVGLKDELDTEARYLSHGQRQWLAISTLILSSPKLLLVDEPAAGLTDSETELTAELLLELKGDHTLIIIEHDMDFVRRLDSFVTMLHEGKIMAEGTLEELQQNEEVIEAYLGR